MAEETPQRLAEAARLQETGRMLDELAKERKIGAIYEREEIVDKCIRLLALNVNVVLVGEPGTGKNAVVESIAHKIANNEISHLDWQHIVEVNATRLQWGCIYAGNLENKMNQFVNNCESQKAIIFFDQIHEGVGAGAGSQDPENDCITILANCLQGRRVPVMGATTADGYRILQRAKPSFINRFVKVDIPPTDDKETLSILRSVRQSFEGRYSVRISDDLLEEVIRLYDRFYPWRQFPGKAFEGLKNVISRRKRDAETPTVSINRDDLYVAIKEKSGLPDIMIFPDQGIDPGEIRSYFKERIFGQDEAIDELVYAIIRFKEWVNDPAKPVGSYIFAGPSGVGKTELAKVLAEYLFGSEKRLMVYPMSQYQGMEGVKRLLGGRLRDFYETGRLIGDVMSTPFSVILLDEIDQASEEVIYSLYQILDEGKLIDPVGKTVYFTTSIIIMSTNVGMERYFKRHMGIRVEAGEKKQVISEEIRKGIKRDLERRFGVPFLNRVTKVVPFHPLDYATIGRIAEKAVKDACSLPGLVRRNIHVVVDRSVLDLLVKRGYDQRYGARPMQGVVRDIVINPIAEYLARLGGNAREITLRVELEDERAIIRTISDQ